MAYDDLHRPDIVLHGPYEFKPVIPVESLPRQDGARNSSGLFTLNEDRITARGARIARRDDRGYREYLREEQRREAGCPARKPVLDQREQATRHMAR